eukprot:s3048_g3.t1
MAWLRRSLLLLSLQAVAGVPENSTRGLSDAYAAPAHAGCFVKNGDTMLAVKLTYDGNKFDIPGGRTDGHEPAPATKTAERETWEESGYSVEVGELLATVRGGFHIFRCRLKEQNPGKGPDHEVSSVQWIHSWEFDNFMQCPGCRHAICLLLPHALASSVFAPRQHMWRFQDDQAHLYGQWLRNDAGNNNQRVEEQGQHQKPDHDSNDQSSGEHRRLIMV